MSFKETYNIDGKQAEQALKALDAAQKRLGETTEGNTKKLSAEDKATRRLAEGADAMKKFNRQHEELAVLVGKGKITFDEAAVASGKYHRQLEMAGRAQEATFGARAMSSLTSYAAGFVGVGTALSGVNMLLSDMEQNAKSAAARIRDSLESVGELQQIEGLLENIDFAREMRRKGVVANVGEGGRLANSLDQAGFSEADQRFIAFDLVGSKFLSAADGAEVATKYAKVQGLLKMGSLKETLNKVLEAGADGSSTNPEVADAITKYGGMMKSLGYSDSEILTMYDNADRQSPNAAGAAERLKSLGSQLSKKGLVKGDWMTTINSIRDRERAGENINAILGEANAVLAYQFYDEDSEQKTFRRKLGLVASAPERDLLGQQVGGIFKDPQSASGIYAERATRRLEQGREDRTGTLQNLFEAARDNLVDYHEGQGNYGQAYGTRSAAWIKQRFGNQGVFLDEALATERGIERQTGGEGAFSKEFEQQVIRLLKEQNANGWRTVNAIEEGSVRPSAE